MIIVYESKTGFTKRYAEMLAAKTGMKVYRVNELSKIDKKEEIVFLGWMKVGRIQGLKKVRKFNVKAVCGSGTGRAGEPNAETIITGNKLEKIPFFYAQGGCLPLKDLKGTDRFMMSMFAKMLKKRKDKDENLIKQLTTSKTALTASKRKILSHPLIEWLNSR